MSEWVLVPVEPSAGMIDSLLIPDDPDGDEPMTWRERFAYALAARPPMPRAEWGAMVERMARAYHNLDDGRGEYDFWNELPEASRALRMEWMATALRAALPGLVVEGE